MSRDQTLVFRDQEEESWEWFMSLVKKIEAAALCEKREEEKVIS